MLVLKTILWVCVALAIMVILLAMGVNVFLDWPLLGVLSPLKNWETEILINFAGFLMIMVAFLQQSIANRASDKDHNLQRFEDKFFQMIQLHHQNIFTLNQRYQHDPAHNESDFFFFTYDHLMTKEGKEIEEMIEEYQGIYELNRHFVDHFVNYLMTIIRYVWDTKVIPRKEEKIKYLTILENQLPTAELWVFFVDILFRKNMNTHEAYFMNHPHIQGVFFQRISTMPVVNTYLKTFPFMKEKEEKISSFSFLKKFGVKKNSQNKAPE